MEILKKLGTQALKRFKAELEEMIAVKMEDLLRVAGSPEALKAKGHIEALRSIIASIDDELWHRAKDKSMVD